MRCVVKGPLYVSFHNYIWLTVDVWLVYLSCQNWRDTFGLRYDPLAGETPNWGCSSNIPGATNVVRKVQGSLLLQQHTSGMTPLSIFGGQLENTVRKGVCLHVDDYPPTIFCQLNCSIWYLDSNISQSIKPSIHEYCSVCCTVCTTDILYLIMNREGSVELMVLWIIDQPVKKLRALWNYKKRGGKLEGTFKPSVVSRQLVTRVSIHLYLRAA